MKTHLLFVMFFVGEDPTAKRHKPRGGGLKRRLCQPVGRAPSLPATSAARRAVMIRVADLVGDGVLKGASAGNCSRSAFYPGVRFLEVSLLEKSATSFFEILD